MVGYSYLVILILVNYNFCTNKITLMLNIKSCFFLVIHTNTHSSSQTDFAGNCRKFSGQTSAQNIA